MTWGDFLATQNRQKAWICFQFFVLFACREGELPSDLLKYGSLNFTLLDASQKFFSF